MRFLLISVLLLSAAASSMGVSSVKYPAMCRQFEADETSITADLVDRAKICTEDRMRARGFHTEFDIYERCGGFPYTAYQTAVDRCTQMVQNKRRYETHVDCLKSKSLPVQSTRNKQIRLLRMWETCLLDEMVKDELVKRSEIRVSGNRGSKAHLAIICHPQMGNANLATVNTCFYDQVTANGLDTVYQGIKDCSDSQDGLFKKLATGDINEISDFCFNENKKLYDQHDYQDCVESANPSRQLYASMVSSSLGLLETCLRK